MADQIVEITNPGYRLTKSRGFLEVHNEGEKVGNIPLDDILSVIISVPGCMISTVVIEQLSQRNIPLVMSGQNYLPTSFTLPLHGYTQQYKVMQSQMRLSEPRRKRAWQKIIQSKILNQATVLEFSNRSKSRQLLRLAEKVKSGDTDNYEAQAGRIYWQGLFGKNFRRDVDTPGINSALNYAYAVVRSCVARGISGAGLHPTFSVHHKNSRNPFNLADDLIEPFRPCVDYLIWKNRETSFLELTPAIKENLVSIINEKVQLGDYISPISQASLKMAKSFADYCLGDRENLDLPTVLTSP